MSTRPSTAAVPPTAPRAHGAMRPVPALPPPRGRVPAGRAATVRAATSSSLPAQSRSAQVLDAEGIQPLASKASLRPLPEPLPSRSALQVPLPPSSPPLPSSPSPPPPPAQEQPRPPPKPAGLYVAMPTSPPLQPQAAPAPLQATAPPSPATTSGDHILVRVALEMCGYKTMRISPTTTVKELKERVLRENPAQFADPQAFELYGVYESCYGFPDVELDNCMVAYDRLQHWPRHRCSEVHHFSFQRKKSVIEPRQDRALQSLLMPLSPPERFLAVLVDTSGADGQPKEQEAATNEEELLKPLRKFSAQLNGLSQVNTCSSASLTAPQ
eukprot:TRINITY_DN823_c0_g1_i2.p1 TRINITY_DN823_c0_g1~~TRINITY_DN823_c0_g1_i2.p1  ORF type:complete len:327 (+),score=69.72 TRINITY_DN823_c0_g1_i2:20-1000(+)